MEEKNKKVIPEDHVRFNHRGEGPIDSLARSSWKLYTNPFFNSSPHRRIRRQSKREGGDMALGTELDAERWMRKKVELECRGLRREVEEERQRRGVAEREAEELSSELRRVREEMRRVRGEVNEERRRMRVEDVARVERAQMQLTEARLRMEERLLAVVGDGRKEERPPTRKEVENPHIKRGIVGFVEFPRVRSAREGKRVGEMTPKLECQKAQLRVLMRRSRVSPVGNNAAL